MVNTYLSFIIGNELFAVNVIKVLEVLQKQNITQVPNAPEYIRGIINFRGEVVPVFEVRTMFNFAPRTEGDSFVIIVFDLSNDEYIFRVGAIVDKVRDVISIDENQIKPVPPMSKDFNPEFLSGIYKICDNFILILNIEKVFSTVDKELSENAIHQFIVS